MELNEKELEITTMRAGGKAATKLVKHVSSTSAASKEDLEITRMRAGSKAASKLVKHVSS